MSDNPEQNEGLTTEEQAAVAEDNPEVAPPVQSDVQETPPSQAEEPQAGVNIPDSSAGGDTLSTPDASQAPLQETDTTAPEEGGTEEGGVGHITEEGVLDELPSEREVIVGEQGLGDEKAADHSATLTGGGYDPSHPVATSAPPAAAQTGVPNLPENADLDDEE
jgi:hypothetical protein